MAGYQGDKITQTFVAAADLSASQYRLVQLLSTNKVNVESADNNWGTVGILDNKPSAANRHASVVVQGPAKAVAGAAISSYWVPLKSDTVGRVVVATSGDIIIGRNKELAAAAGDVIQVYVHPGQKIAGL